MAPGTLQLMSTELVTARHAGAAMATTLDLQANRQAGEGHVGGLTIKCPVNIWDGGMVI